MKTQTTNKPSSARFPCAAHDVAPSLVSTDVQTRKRKKGRAKEFLPASPRTAGASELPAHEQAVIDAAMAILRHRMRQPGACLDCPTEAATLVMLQLGELDRECFLVLLLDARSRLIAIEEVARGTLTQVVVHAREVVRAAMRHNACAVILAHNHPSGFAVPSDADIMMTKHLKAALAVVDVVTLDHLVVAGDRYASLASLNKM